MGPTPVKEWKCKHVQPAPSERAKEIQLIQEKQALLKSKELEVCRKVALSRGVSAAHYMNLEQMKKEEVSRNIQEARQQALIAEKERARRRALCTPPPMELPPPIQENVNADFYDLQYMGTWPKSCETFEAVKPQYITKGTASFEAVLLREEKENYQKIQQVEIENRNQVTSQRFLKAIKKQKTLQVYDSVLTDLEAAHQEDISRKKALITRNGSKRAAMKDDFQPTHSAKQDKLQKEIETLLFESKGMSTCKVPDNPEQYAESKPRLGLFQTTTTTRHKKAEVAPHQHGSFGKRKDFIDQMRSERQKCMERWRPESSKPQELSPSNHDDSPSTEKQQPEESHDILNQGRLNFGFDEFSDDEVDAQVPKSQERILPQRDFNDLETKVKNSQTSKECEDSSLKMDATTQTVATNNLLPSSSRTTTTKPDSMSLSSKKTLKDPSLLGTSNDLKLGLNVAVPVVSVKTSKATSVSEFIQKVALRTFATMSGVTQVKLPDPVKPKLFENLIESQFHRGNAAVKCQKQDRTNSSPRMFADLPSNKLGKSDVIASKAENELPIPPTFVKRKIIIASSPFTLEQTEEFGSCAETVSRGQLTRAAPDEKLNLITADVNSAKKLSSQETPFTEPAFVKLPKASPTFFQDMQIQGVKTLAKNNSNQSTSHKSYFCKPRLFESIAETSPTIPAVSKEVHQPVKVVKEPSLSQHSVDVVSLIENNDSPDTRDQCHPTISECLLSSSETYSFEETTTSSDVSLPNYLRHSLATELRQNNKVVSEENIHRLLESIVEFENVESYIRPPPPVSYRGVTQGMEDAYPHELSTIVEVDTPQNSFMKSMSKSQPEVVGSNFTSFQESEGQNSVLLTSPVKDPDVLYKVSTTSAGATGKRLLSFLSPPFSIPSTCSTISDCLKSISSTSTTSSKLSEAFKSANIRTHSTPIKDKDSHQDSLESNIIDQSVTLIEGFTLDGSAVEAISHLHTTSMKSKENRGPQTCNLLRPYQSSRMFKASPKKFGSVSPRVFPLHSFNSGGVLLESVPSLRSAVTQLSPVTSTGNSTVSDSLLSFMQHEQSINSSSAINLSFFN